MLSSSITCVLKLFISSLYFIRVIFHKITNEGLLRKTTITAKLEFAIPNRQTHNLIMYRPYNKWK